jgi:hypothetical protein
LNNYLRTPRTQLDYQVAASFFAISAVKDDTIYYSRCNFSRSAIHCFDLVYPAGEKHAWDSIVTRISLSLRPLQREFAAKPEAELTQQFHAEFGYFHPGARLRRDVRFALASFASGAVLGAIAIVAVYVSYAKPENASARGLVNNVAAETGIPVVPGSATAEHRNQQRQVRPSTAENTAVVAKLPLGRPLFSRCQLNPSSRWEEEGALCLFLCRSLRSRKRSLRRELQPRRIILSSFEVPFLHARRCTLCLAPTFGRAARMKGSLRGRSGPP